MLISALISRIQNSICCSGNNRIIIVSIGLGFLDYPLNYEIQWFGNYPGSPENNFSGTNFWIVFAIYFPAVTGIMAGANMSGDLKDPRISIPMGTLAAVILSYFVYIAMAIFVAYLASPTELVENYYILIEKAYFAPVVVLGLLGATFSSALSSLVGAPRILLALGENNILIYNDKLAKKDKKGEPKFAFYFTCFVVVLSLLMRDLNAIAPILTMFFLITYAMINVVVLIEQGLGQISFRPTIHVPIIVPILGAIGCFFVMFIINSTVGLISIGLVITMYVYLTKRKSLTTQGGDTRSGMFNALAEWSAKVVNRLPEANERAWQPNLLIPARFSNDVIRSYKIIYSLARPKGSIKILGFPVQGRSDLMSLKLKEIVDYFMETDISANSAIVENVDFKTGVLISIQGLKASFFTPNCLFLSLTDETDIDAGQRHFLEKAPDYGFGAYLYVPYKKVGLGLEKRINLWIDLKRSDLKMEFEVEDINLAILTAYLLKRNWNARLNLIIESGKSQNDTAVKRFVQKLLNLSRMPKDTNVIYWEKDKAISNDAPNADLHIFSMKKDEVNIERMRTISEELESSLLYTLDGGQENALA